MKAIVPAAGYATRMYPLTKDKPKGLLSVGGKPMMEYVIGRILTIQEVDEIFVVTNAKFFEQFREWAKTFECKVPVKVINDGTTSNEDRLGSIGDIQFVIAQEKIDDDVIIVNSDNLFTFALSDLVGLFKEKKKAIIGVYDCGSLEQAKKMGNLELDESLRVVGFVEKPPEPKGTVCSIGVYLYPKEVVPKLKQYLDEGNSADKTGEFVDWLYKNEEVYGFVFEKDEDKWFDIGSLEMYNEVKDGFE